MLFSAFVKSTFMEIAGQLRKLVQQHRFHL